MKRMMDNNNLKNLKWLIKNKFKASWEDLKIIFEKDF
jgi:hypothetical protein